MKKLILIFALLLLPGILDAATRTATPGTLNAAIGQMQTGDTLYLKNGVYAQTLTNPLPSNSTMEGESTAGVILRPPSGGGNAILLNSNRTNLTFRKFTIDAVNLRTGETTGFRTNSATVLPNLILEDLEVKNMQGSAIVIGDNVSNCRVSRNKLHDSVGAMGQSAGGVYMRGDGCIVEHNEIWKVPSYASSIRNDGGKGTGHTYRFNKIWETGQHTDGGIRVLAVESPNNLIHNNLIINNSKKGVQFNRGYSGNRFFNNVVWGNGGVGVLTSGTGTHSVEVKNNIIIENKGGQLTGSGLVTETNLLSGRAADIFVDHLKGNFKPKPTATMVINKGTPVPGIPYTLPAPTIGAFEADPVPDPIPDPKPDPVPVPKPVEINVKSNGNQVTITIDGVERK